MKAKYCGELKDAFQESKFRFMNVSKFFVTLNVICNMTMATSESFSFLTMTDMSVFDVELGGGGVGTTGVRRIDWTDAS